MYYIIYLSGYQVGKFKYETSANDRYKTLVQAMKTLKPHYIATVSLVEVVKGDKKIIKEEEIVWVNENSKSKGEPLNW